MSTTSTTSDPFNLIKRTDVTATHLIIVGQGKQVGRRVIVPKHKMIHHYLDDTPDTPLKMGMFGRVLRGELPPRESVTPGNRATDYLLMPTGEDASRPTSARYPDAQWHRYVEQSDHYPGAVSPEASHQLGQGVACDILRLRHPSVTQWVNRRAPRLSQLLQHELLRQYISIHCIFSYAPPLGCHAASPYGH